MDDESEKIILIDEDGSENEFTCLDYIELNNNRYVVLTEFSDIEEEEEEIIILKVVTENEEDTFLTIEDEDEMDLIFEEFKNRIEEEL
jgi:uncharacterized protein YrzB (UPF0473 family)